MKIKSIKLHNFMRYKGDNELRFSTDTDKNVTIVLGDNTFGKTTIAQAFRWGLYEILNDTAYTKRKDVVLLNNEVAAEMSANQIRHVYVEIIILDEDAEYRFTRTAAFTRKNTAASDIDVKQLGPTQLTMQVKTNNVWGSIINDPGNNNNTKGLGEKSVQDAINNMLPQSLSNYFFFDGERWKDLKSKTSDIRDSINTILGVSGLIKMQDHLKDDRISVKNVLRSKLQGITGEYDRIKTIINGLDDLISDYESKLKDITDSIETVERTIEDTQRTLTDNRKVEEDQKEVGRLEADIMRYNKFKQDYYADIVKELSNSAKFFTSTLLDDFNGVIERIDLEGKDIPGVTVDTLDYLLNLGECLCGAKLEEKSEAYENIIKLRKQVPPEMLGGATGKLKATLEAWKSETKDFRENIIKKANDFDLAQSTIDERTRLKDKLEMTIDRKTNLGPIREKNKEARNRLIQLNSQKATIEVRIEEAKKNKLVKEQQLDEIAINNKNNAQIYRCLSYVDAMYDVASSITSKMRKSTLSELNSIINDNFRLMFNDHEKYAKLGDDYRIHVYYLQIGDLTDYEEENLSNGELIAINFVFIVSVLELAKKYRDSERDNSVYGLDKDILGLPLVLDGPFSSLSNDNTSLVASRLPKFAEQVIIFMLDKDWKASGLERYTLPEYCYRVNKDYSSNSSSIEKKEVELHD